MFFSHCLISRNGPLRVIWVAAYCYKKLKKSQVVLTDIPSSVDKILEDEFNLVTYRVLAYLLLGVVRIYSKKVEYLHGDCNKVLLKIKDYVHRFKDKTLMKTVQAPYFSITLPKRFELDAFDLEILEDTTGCNVVPLEEITLKDNTWKSGVTYHCSLDKYHYEEFAARPDTCSSGYALNEDVLSCHLMDFEMEVGTSYDGSNPQAIMEKHQDSQQKCEDFETFYVEERPPDPVKSSCGNNNQTGGDHRIVPEVIDSDKMPAGSSRHGVLDDGLCQQASVNVETCNAAEEESRNSVMSSGEHHHSSGQEIVNSDIEMHQEQCILNDTEASIEKVRECRSFQEAIMDVEKSCATEMPQQCARSFDQAHQSDAEHSEMTFSGNSKCPAVTKDLPSSITRDATPQSKFCDMSGAITPEFSVIHTPVTTEHPRVRRKRKCLLDDFILFPNNVIKQFINDASDLVCKRRKAPCTTLDAWKSVQVFNVHRCFSQPLIACASSELESLFCEEKLKIAESVEAIEVSQEFESQPSIICRQAQTITPSAQKDNLESCTVGRSVKSVKPLEKLLSESSPCSSRPVEPIEPPEKIGAFVSSSPGKPLESIEQAAIAPETPIKHATAPKSYESPEKREISNSDALRFESEIVNKQLSPNKDLEPDLSFMNENLNSCEGDEQHGRYGWSERTRMAAKCLNSSFLQRKKRKGEEVVSLLQLLEGRSDKVSARLFYEILVLKSTGFVKVKQENAYGDILIWKTCRWDEVPEADSVKNQCT